MNVSESEESTDAFGIQKEVLARVEQACELVHANMTEPDLPQGSYCPRIFDGWSCWNDTPSGTEATVDCPAFVPGFDPNRKGIKLCMENGSWFKHPSTDEYWSNYTNCVDMSSLQMHQTINRIHISGYTISLVFLIASLVIFFYFRSLQCKRVLIHKNLFTSFIINNTLYLIWHAFVAETPEVVNANGIGCRILHVLSSYFLLSNFMWMFCEGLYLHTLLAVAFVSENKILKWFFIIGWGFPVAFTVAYAAARGSDPEASLHCWIEEETAYKYILSVPVCVSMIVNLIFLVNIVRVLVTKLRTANTGPDHHSTRKAVRATLILIPLLGLNYILTPFRPPDQSPWHFPYLVVAAIGSSFQGLAVALLFCFFNGEVLAIFKKKWRERQVMRFPNSYTAATSVTYKNSLADGVTMATHVGTSLEGDDM